MRIALGILLAVSLRTETAPVVLGLHHARHGLDAMQRGRVLISELRCVACHANGSVAKKTGPNLSEVGWRVAPAFMKRFIADPATTDPGTQMPDLLGGNTKRTEIAESLTHYLVSLSSKPFKSVSVKESEFEAGKKLFNRIGCVNCHLAGERRVQLSHVAIKYSSESLADFLFHPRHTRPSGRMPDMNLTRAESKLIAGYLIGLGGHGPSRLNPEAGKVAAGKKFFKRYNCASCHELEGEKSKPTLALNKLRAGHGCLSAKPASVPHFRLNDSQREVIGKALTGIEKPLSDKAQIQQTLTAFNCIACHTRDGTGGVSNAVFKHFGTDEEGLGNPASIPPTLDLVGAKLRPEWLRKVLFDKETVRPYMHTRMPQFGEVNLRYLPALLEAVDQLAKVELPEPKRDDRRMYRESGHQLVGDKGLNCVACHNFNGKPSPGLKGMDLLTSFERLQPSWFVHFMRNPQKYRSGIVMPNYWPGGVAVRKDVLEGNADEQLLALWYFFSLGRSARDPSGIRSVGTNLKITDRARVYRGRIRIAGYRGIAVGFPGGINYAFNAEYGTLSGLWEGDFVSVYWRGQGAGNFNPRARPIELAQDVAFYRLAKDDTPWPLRPKMDKNSPVNPDPLYPHNLGYQFKGYQLDVQSVPTFLYRTAEIAVKDRSVANQPSGLVRTIQFDAPKAETIYFRALTGNVKAVSMTKYTTESVRLSVPKTPVLLRGEGEEKELLLKLKLPKGSSGIEIRYELLR